MMSQFSSLTEALLELVDNAFDEFDGIHGGKNLSVDIVITKHSITVGNIGGKGMGVRELSNWLNWGEPTKTDAIGEYGQGGKAAMGYLGSSWVVRAKKWNENVVNEIRDDKWDDLTAKEKTYKVVSNRDEGHSDIGFCKFEIRKLKKHRQEINRIRLELANTYRAYLSEGKATINVNYESVMPLIIPVYEGYSVQQFRVKTNSGFSVRGWVGRLKRDTRVKGEPKIIGGMRLLRKGRLICGGEYFGHPDFRYKASLGTLIGEVELPKVPILPNKTGFDTDAVEWIAAQDVMHSILKPHIEALLSQREEETVTREEKKRMSQVRDMMAEALKLLEKYELSSRFAEERGRKSPEKKAEEGKRLQELEEERSTSSTKEPRTPPPKGAIGKLKRMGRMPEWELRILEPDIRSDWGEKEGRRCLLINKKYCLYNERDGDDLYIAETAVLELAKPEGEDILTLKEYLSDVNLLMRAFCEVYSSTST